MTEIWQQWYPHNIKSWNSSAAVFNMTDAAYKAYHQLLMAQFESEDGMLPGDSKQLAKLSRMGIRWTAVREELPTIAEEVLEEFEAGPDGRIFNAVMYREWKKARDTYHKRTHKPPHKVPHEVGDEVGDEDTESPSLSPPQIQEQIQEQKTKATPPQAVTLPDWVPTEAWQGFLEMRRKMRAPLTARAIRKTITDLESLRASGQDPGDVLDQSTQRCWKGVFPIRSDYRPSTPQPRRIIST